METTMLPSSGYCQSNGGPDPADSGNYLQDAVVPPLTLREAQHEWRRAFIQAVYERCQGNKSLTARVLGLDRVHLYQVLHRYAIPDLPGGPQEKHGKRKTVDVAAAE